MDHFLNFGPIILASVVAVLAVWGDYTKKNEIGIFRRLLPRGWWALFFTLVALGAAVGKQIHDNRAANKQQQEFSRLVHETATNSAGVVKVSTGIGDVSTKVSTVDEKVDSVTREIKEIKKLLDLGVLVGFAQSKGELPIKPGDILNDSRFSEEVRGERVYNMEKVLSEIHRLKESLGLDDSVVPDGQ